MEGKGSEHGGKGGKGGDQYRLRFMGLKAGEERPKVVVQALDQGGKVLHSDRVGAEGEFSLPARVLEKAHRVVIGAPAPDEGGGGLAEGALRYRPKEFLANIREGTLTLARNQPPALPSPPGRVIDQGSR